MSTQFAQDEPQQAVDRVLRDAGVAFTAVRPKHEGDFDIEVTLRGRKTRLYLDYHPAISSAQFPSVARRLAARVPPAGRGGLVVRHLTLTLLDACKAHGLCAFDLEGNAYLRAPGVFIDRYRPSTPPQRAPSAGTCFTAKASRLVRTLFAHYPHFATQTALAKATGLSRGYVSILVARLVADGYVSNHFGQLYLEQPDRLLDDWVAHYRFDRHRKLHFALSMNSYEQGLEKLSGQLRATGVQFAFTGWSGAYLRAPYASPTVLMAYAAREPSFTGLLFPVEKHGNVILLLPQDDGVLSPCNESPFGPVVSDVQVYLDLCRMPGRAREQADALRHERLDFGGAPRDG